MGGGSARGTDLVPGPLGTAALDRLAVRRRPEVFRETVLFFRIFPVLRVRDAALFARPCLVSPRSVVSLASRS